MPEASSTILTQTELVFGAEATVSVMTASVAEANAALALISVGA